VFSTAAGGVAVFWLGGGGLWRRLRGVTSAREETSPVRLEPDAAREDRAVVLVVCGNGPDPITLRKIEAIASSGAHDVHLVYWRDAVSLRTYPFSVAISPSSIHPIDLPDPNGPPLRGLGLLIRFHAGLFSIAATLQPDVVHAVNFDMLIGAWLLCLGRPHRTLVYDLLDTHESLRRWPVVLVQRAIMRRVDRIYTTSPQFVSGFLRALRLIRPGDHPVVIPNAPWAATFDGIASRRDGPFVVGYIGSFRGEPAIAWLCESVEEVRRSGMDVEILFAGTGEARPLVESMARRHRFVQYEGAYDYATDIRMLYERVDLVFAVYDVSWDKRTHLACRLSDAIAAGRPIVAAAGTYMGDLVEAHRLGYVVDFADPSSLTAAIRDAVERRAEWSDPCRIPAELRRDHTFEYYVPDLHSSYDLVRRQKSL
jgi:glycosyltransferase involved in cell wall biosynthesis